MVPDARRPRFPGTPNIAGVSSHHREPLAGDWSLLRASPGSAKAPPDLDNSAEGWTPAIVPGTVASAQRARGVLPELDRVEDYDASDWWYRCHFKAPTLAPDEEAWLGFEGLATLAEVWLNGSRVATSDNMFRELEVPVGSGLRPDNVLHIRFRSLRAELAQRRPRPRWRTGLVEHQQLRWFRTTLLGRIPGWSPPVRAVGPWRPVWLERRRVVGTIEGDAIPDFGEGGARVEVDFEVHLIGAARVHGATLEIAGATHTLAVEPAGTARARIAGAFGIAGAEAWWPHTHGGQPRYPAAVRLETSAGPVTIDLGRIAFRSMTVDRDGGGFQLSVNGVPVFCRGACWTNCDIVSLRGTDIELDHLLGLARDAHMNMLRVGGTMVYEDHRFHDRCDELGIMVWQDFMYANMDYPADDGAFLAAAAEEAAAVIARRRRFASTAVWCGGSEVEQQAAMLGLPENQWSNALFSEVLPALCAMTGRDAVYARNSPTGGPLPFTVDSGISHYYGVGAYLRPLEDARRAGVRFTSETLGFANVPAAETLEEFLAPGQAPPHHPRWKARVPRDTGPGWDFDDIRDHYLRTLFGADPLGLRYADVERYLSLSRVVTGEVMAKTFAEWRSGGTCRGGLVWFFQDLWPGAGWGVVDALGRPKAAWYYLQRAFAPRATFLTDEGLNGHVVHVMNEASTPLSGQIRVTLHRSTVAIASGSRDIIIPARQSLRLAVDELLGVFSDSTWSYRFGRPGHDLVVAELCDAHGVVLSRDVAFPIAPPIGTDVDTGLSIRLVHAAAGSMTIELRSERTAYAVQLTAGDWRAAESFVTIPPGGHAVVELRGRPESRPTTIEAMPVNAQSPTRLRVPALAEDSGP
jgi:beta-mannosidase